MRKLFLFTLLLTNLSFFLYAQESNLNDSTAQEVKDEVVYHIKGETSDFLPDSTDVDRAKGSFKNAVKDSLNHRVPVPDVNLDSTLVDEAKRRAKGAIRDSINQYIDVPEVKLDSTLADQASDKAKTEAKGRLEDELGEEIPDVTLDSTTVDQVKEKAVDRAEEELRNTDEFKALNGADGKSPLSEMKEYKNKIEQTQEEIKQAAAKQELKKKMASHAKKYISQNSDKIQQVQSKMGELKKKYSYLPNSNDLSSAVKRNSLENESFWERLTLGGNFNISKTSPLSIDFSPVIGYRINKLFEAGITGCYRGHFKADKYQIGSQTDKQVYGYSAYANHMVFKNFFGYLEAERMRTTDFSSEELKRDWEQTLLIGIGRRFNVAKWLEMQALVLYNVLHDNTDNLYESPVVFKTGFRLKK